MTTRTPVSQGSRLALMAALCCAGLAQAQVAGSSTLLGVGVIEAGLRKSLQASAS